MSGEAIDPIRESDCITLAALDRAVIAFSLELFTGVHVFAGEV